MTPVSLHCAINSVRILTTSPVLLTPPFTQGTHGISLLLVLGIVESLYSVSP